MAAAEQATLQRLQEVLAALAFDGISAVPNPAATHWQFHFHGHLVAEYAPCERKLVLLGKRRRCDSPVQLRAMLRAAIDTGQLYAPLLADAARETLSGIQLLKLRRCSHWLFFHKGACVCQYWPRRGVLQRRTHTEQEKCASHAGAWAIARKTIKGLTDV